MDLARPQLGQGTKLPYRPNSGLLLVLLFRLEGLESKRCCFRACLQRRIQIQASHRPDLASLVARQGQMLFLHHRVRQGFSSEYPLALLAQADIPCYPLIHPKGYLDTGRDYLKHHHRLYPAVNSSTLLYSLVHQKAYLDIGQRRCSLRHCRNQVDTVSIRQHLPPGSPMFLDKGQDCSSHHRYQNRFLNQSTQYHKPVRSVA